MNDPSKAINVNLSSLLSLKAELLRKQGEVNKAKTSTSQNQQNKYSSKKLHTFNGNSLLDETQSNKKNKNNGIKKVHSGDQVTIYEHEDNELMEKSKRVLEAKNKYYERMTRTGGHLNSDDNCLVLFNRKHQEECKDNNYSNKYVEPCSGNDSNNKNSQNESEDEKTSDEDDWIEYIDCLGRTRKCPRQDLEAIKKRDAELAASMPERLDQSKVNWMINTKDTHKGDVEAPYGPTPCESLYSDGVSLMSKHDEQRASWERKEQENLDKIDVHYQDVFFDEARQHGVGYYTFSTDEEERKKQQKDLEDARKCTMEEQNRREQLRAQREKIISERVFAAKNRQRARLGLPPLEKVKEKEENTNTKETKEERRAKKLTEKNKRKQEQYEKERELERNNHVRPWDKEKLFIESSKSVIDNGILEPKWFYKPDKLPMSQEQWNEKKRSERISEFGPVDISQIQEQFQPKRKNFGSMPIQEELGFMQKSINDELSRTENFANYQSSKSDRTFQRRSYRAETTDSDRMGAAIAPPVDLDYVQPPHSKKLKSNTELESSIEAGLRFLRNNCDKGSLTTKSSWTAKADY